MPPANPVEFSRKGADGRLVRVGNQVRVENGAGLISSSNPLAVTDSWRVGYTSAEDANDSDVQFTAPAGEEWQVLWIWVELTSDGTAGNRQMVIEVKDGAGDVKAQLARAGVVQGASVTRNYLFAPSAADLTAFRDSDFVTTPLPPTALLAAGDVLRVYDSKAIAAAADDMMVHLQYAYRSV